MKVLYHFPHYNTTIYAYRTIVNGFMHAFMEMGHEFKVYTSDDNLKEQLSNFNPDIFLTQSHHFYQRYLDLNLLKRYRDNGMVMFTKIDFWNNTISVKRVNEAKNLKDDKETIRLIKKGLLGDYFYHVVEQNDPRMDGFERETGQKFFTIPLAADKTVLLKSKYVDKYKSDISFIGTNLPEKRQYFGEYVFPLGKKYKLKLYGQDWTEKDKILGWVQRGGQYFNIPFIRSAQKPKLSLEDEGNIYASSSVSINVHEDYQRKFGGDCNERTFKIPMAGGFEITDDVLCIRKYFKDGEEIIIAKDKKDWFEKIDYYIKNPKKREEIIRKGKERVLREHTYNNRVALILKIAGK